MAKPTVTEIAERAVVKKYAPRPRPTPIPDESWDEGRVLCLKANEQWMAHILGALEVLDQFDTWVGDADQVRAARDQVNEILASVDDCEDDMCCCKKVIIYRFNPETGRMEQSDDGGLTWENAADPRYDNPTIPNPYTGTDDNKKCLGASNVEAVFQEHTNELLDEATLWTGITGLIPIILQIIIWLGVVASFGALTPIALALTAALMGVGKAAFEAAMTGEVWNTFACIVYCHIEPDASFTEEQILAIQDDLYAQLTGIAPRFLADYVKILGVVGMTNAARSGRVAIADCSDCMCGDQNCGFYTDQYNNTHRWQVATELVNTAIFDKPPAANIGAVNPPFYAAGNQTLAAFTEFPEPCYITTVVIRTLGRSNPGYVTVAYKLVEDGEWIDAGTQQYSSWAYANPRTWTINTAVVAIQVQSEAFNSGQQNFTDITIFDPTP